MSSAFRVAFFDFDYIRYISAVTRDLVTLNNTLSIPPSPLAAGSIRNAENMESLLHIDGATGFGPWISTTNSFSTFVI